MNRLAKRLSVGLALVGALVFSAFSPVSAEAQAKPLKNMPVFGVAGTSTFTGQLSITELTLGEEGLLASGTVSGFLSRRRITHSFNNVPIALFAEGATDIIELGGLRPFQLSPDEPLVCDILFLDLGPLNLELLGLRLDLAEVVLDLDAVSGPGNLVGNLLCAITGLLDVVDIGVLISSILEALLDALNSLL